LSDDLQKFNEFADGLRKYNSNLKIKYKNESLLMKVIDKLLFFNKTFMTDFTTTIGNTVYFPDRTFVEEKSISARNTLAHEFVHTEQINKYTSIIFSFLYFFPQSLSLFVIIFLCFGTWVPALITLLALAPIPAYFRMKFELEGYQMTLFMINETMKEYGYGTSRRREKLLKIAIEISRMFFVNSTYYFMWPFGVESQLTETVEKILNGDILKTSEAYEKVLDALYS